MFKSIEYRLNFFIVLLIASVIMSTVFVIQKEYAYLVLSSLFALYAFNRLHHNYRKFNKNIVFLLNALENGDYSFKFKETKLSRRERELNQIMNRIKDILVKARTEIIENEKFLSVIMESVSTGIIILDENDMVVQANGATSDLLGLPVFTHLKQLSSIDNSLPDRFKNLNKTDSISIKVANEREENQLSIRSSQIVIKGKKLKIVSLSNIGSELAYMEMDSWIRLVRVLTHEIMNSIAPVTSLTDTILSAYANTETPDNDDNLRENTIEALQTIHTTATGLMSFVKSYRRFTAIPKPQFSPLSLHSVIDKTLTLNAGDFKEKDISVKLILPIEKRLLLLDEAQIMQVLQNLFKNAADASPNTGKQIKIELTEEDAKTNLDIANNGHPIPEEVLPNIFVPFFTTKEAGTGIGLSVSRYIMRLHGGTLTHFNDNEWTVFRLSFQKQ